MTYGMIKSRDPYFKRRPVAPKYAPLSDRRTLCGPCHDGDHLKEHSAAMGCTRVIGTDPRDWVCQCMRAA